MFVNGQPRPEILYPVFTIDATSYDISTALGFVLATVTAPANWSIPSTVGLANGAHLTVVNMGAATVTLDSLDPLVFGDTTLYEITLPPKGALQVMTSFGSWIIMGAGNSGFILPLGATKGGTGTTTLPLDGQLLLGSGGSYVPAALSAGPGITTTAAAGSLAVALSTPLAVTRGGTGLTTLPALNTVLQGTGSAYTQTPLSLTNAGSGSSLVVSSAGAALSTRSISAGSSISFVDSGNDIQISAAAAGLTETSETISLAGGEALSTTLTESVLDTYQYASASGSTLPLVTLGAPVADFVKRVTLINPDTAPVQVRTSRGSFLLTNAGSGSALLAYQNSVWAPKTTLPWFTDTLQTTISSRTVASLSADGNAMVVADPTTSTIQAYLRSGAVWATDGAAFTVSSNIGAAAVGTSLSMSSDGLTVAAGGPGDNSGVGAVWIFVKSGGTWSQQTKLLPTGNTGASAAGTSVALAAGGYALAAGGPNDNSGVGATWTWTRSDTGLTWTKRNLLIGTGRTGTGHQGTSVAFSLLGDVLAVGAEGDNSSKGALWTFKRFTVATSWAQTGSKLTYAGSATGNLQGRTVSVSADGTLLSTTAPGANGGNGAIYLFQNVNGVWTSLTSLAPSGSGLVNKASVLAANGLSLLATGTTSTALWLFVFGKSWQQVGSAAFLTLPSTATVPVLSGDSRTLAAQGTAINVYV